MPSEADDAKSEVRELTAEDGATPRKGDAISGGLHCPRCGGLAKRTWSNVATLNLATFFMLLARPPVRAIQPCVRLESDGMVITNSLAWRRSKVYELKRNTGWF